MRLKDLVGQKISSIGMEGDSLLRIVTEDGHEIEIVMVLDPIDIDCSYLRLESVERVRTEVEA